MLDFAQQQWLEANCEQKNDLYQFLNAHLDEEGEWREDAKAFAVEALDAWMDGGEVNFEERIIYNLENDCVKTIAEIANTMNMGLANDMQNAFGVFSNYDLIYKQTNLVDDGNTKTLGQTDITLGNNGKIENITISLDSGLLNSGTDIAIFSTIIHENMHALMFYQLDMLKIAPDNPNIDFSILADQWSQIVAESSGGQLPPNELAYTQHEIMSNLIDTIAGYIMDFASNKGYNMDIIQAEALAWIGLDDSVAWTIMDQNLKDTYENIIDYEISSFEILAVGTECN